MTKQTHSHSTPGETNTSEGTILRFFVLIVVAGCSFFLFVGFANSRPELSLVISSVLLISSLWFYFFPIIEAAIRKHPDRLSIFLVNLFLGWTLLGWVFAFAWACKNQRPVSVYIEKDADVTNDEPVITQKPHSFASVADEISKLSELKERGLITQVEFEAQKAKVLAR